MIGGSQPIEDRREVLARRLHEPLVRQDMLEFDGEFKKDEAVWSLYHGPGERFAKYLEDARVVTDERPWIEYPYFRSLDPNYIKPPEVLGWPPATL